MIILFASAAVDTIADNILSVASDFSKNMQPSSRAWAILLPLLVGWVLGLLGPFIIDWIKLRIRKTKTLKAMMTELMQLRMRLVMNRYILERRYGKYDKELLRWVEPRIREYVDIPSNIVFADNCLKMLGIPDPEFARDAATVQKSEKDMSAALKQYSLPFIASQYQILNEYDPHLQSRIQDVVTTLDLINQCSHEAFYYHRLTFDSEAMKSNEELIRKNLVSTYKFISDLIVILVEKIESIRDTICGDS